MSIPREGSRSTDKGLLVSCAPDWCWTPAGKGKVLIPYRIWAKQQDDANTAPTVRQTGLRSHTSGSLIPVSHGDEPGRLLGLTSGTKESVCWPITWSQTVRIEGKHAVRHNDLWAMNNGNTCGKLAFVEDVKVYKEPKSVEISGEPSPPSTNAGGGNSNPPESGDPFNPSVSVLDDFLADHTPQRATGAPVRMAQVNTGTMTDVGAGRGTGTTAIPAPGIGTGVAAGGIVLQQWSASNSRDAVSSAAQQFGLNTTQSSHYLAASAYAWSKYNSVLTHGVPAGLLTEEVAQGIMYNELLHPGTVGAATRKYDPAAIKTIDAVVAGAIADAKTKANVRVSSVNPCIALACGAPGSKYRGGAHGCTRLPYGDGLDSHHTPADDISPLARSMGPAIQMDPADHKNTASNGSGYVAQNYRSVQKELIDSGNFSAAVAMDIADVTVKYGNKYTQALAQMALYATCLKEHGLVK